MHLKIFLLISDDADDHHAFTEALSEYEKAVVLIILDSQKALQLIVSKMCHLDHVFLDLSTYGMKINSFLKTIRADTELAQLPLVVIGREEDTKRIEDGKGLTYFSKDYSFTDLKNFLKTFLDFSEKE